MDSPPDAFMLAWSNENGNVALATLTFEDKDMAIDWAKKEHQARGVTAIVVNKAKTRVNGMQGSSEVTWQLVPAWNVQAGSTEKLSLDHSESLR